MIRSVIALFVFAVVLCGYIVLSPSENATRPAGIAPDETVTRAVSDTILAPVSFGVELTDDAVIQAPVRAVALGANVPTTDTSADATASNVLAGLGLTAPRPADPTSDPMREMTAGVLSGIGAITGTSPSIAEPAAESALEMLVVQALREGQNDAYIDTIVNEAATAGTIKVPQILVTSDGRVDTHVLLSSIVTQATVAAGGAAPTAPERPEGAEIRIVQRATESQQYRFYTVKRGDSLGAIAMNFYGDVQKYTVIYEANRTTLSSPNQIRIGQRLSIPEV